jgi:predicted Zn-ribbon and HTH transcriptional regulator
MMKRMHNMVDKGVTNLTYEESLEKMDLEYFECGECGFHIALDATYLLQVGDIKMNCPSCKIEWVIQGIEEDE